MPQDIQLEDKVKAALARDPRVDHDHRGTVESINQRQAGALATIDRVILAITVEAVTAVNYLPTANEAAAS